MHTNTKITNRITNIQSQNDKIYFKDTSDYLHLWQRTNYISMIFEVSKTVRVQTVVFWVVTPCSLVEDLSILKMEPVSYSKTLITPYRCTRCHNPKDYDLKIIQIRQSTFANTQSQR
jgi:hypothetical protein